MTADISRHSLRPALNYTGVVRQQGRLPIDADETESDDLASLLLRQLASETICTRGSPDDGFTITDAVLANGKLDFKIAPGTFYLGGTRLETLGHAWSAQPDWLTMTDADRAFALPGAGQNRTDLVWLMGWEQTVTATEDAELLEPGLGGPDTTARRRTMWRVMLRSDVPDTCPEAFDTLIGDVGANGTLNEDGSEILSNARLTVGFTQLDPLDDLCRPQAQAGFLGARNEALRVMINAPGRYVWGRDNAAPLYRVQVVADDTGAKRKIRFVTLPRDEFGWPLAGMTVELLRWGSLLANKEKAAEPLGQFASVTGGFDPGDDNSILIKAANDAALDAFLATPVPAGTTQDPQIDEVGTYIYLRLWSGGGTAGAVDNPMPVASPADLGATGLTVKFASAGIPGDYWVIAARPNTPTRVLPWSLLYGAPPAGPRRMIAPLALITSTDAGVEDPVDCRHHFRPLCEVGACCRVTVGDGRVSFGDTLSIQDAVSRLPAEGGEICIHPGTYTEHVTITGRRNILITGCGPTTVWQAEEGVVAPLLTLEGCDNVVVRRVLMVNQLAEGVLADVPDGQGIDASERIGLEDLSLVVSDRPAVHIRDGRGHIIRRCKIRLGAMSASLSDNPLIGREAAIFLQGRDLLIEHSRIVLEQGEFGMSRTPAGGIHIGGGSRAILIRDNVIDGGNGHGITLGSVQYVPTGEQAFAYTSENYYADYVSQNQYYAHGHGQGAMGSYGYGIVMGEDNCIKIDGTPPPGGNNPDIPVEPESAGIVQNIRIFDNDITRMGFSGISAHVFSGLGSADSPDLIAVERIRIRGNRITNCMRGEVGDLDPIMRLFTGWGGIALSLCTDAVIDDNEIEGNGRRSTDPICGVFLALAEGVVVRDNIIRGNGTGLRDAELVPGMRGGVVIGLGSGGPLSDDGDMHRAGTTSDMPALVMQGNFVSSPNARALRAALIGPCMVHGNRLEGAGLSALFNDPAAAFIGGLVGFSLTGGDIADPRAAIDLADYVGLVGIIELLGGDAVSIVNLGVAEDLSSLLQGTVGQRMRGGETMVNDNQIILRRSTGRAPGTVSSVFLLSADDIALQDNDMEIENDVGYFLTDAFVLGATARITGNRLQERLDRGLLSGITFGLLNNTSNNQSTHCLLAFGPYAGLVFDHNRSVFDMTPKGREYCAAFEDMAGRLSKMLGRSYGMTTGEPVQ